jgi:replicative DNA helicase
MVIPPLHGEKMVNKTVTVQNKELPHSIEAEKGVLGSMLLEKGAITIARQEIEEDDFYSDSHKIIFNAMCTLNDDKSNVDILTLTEQLRAEEKLETVGGHLYITELIDSTVTAANIEHYVKIVKEHSIKRKMIEAAENIISFGYNPAEGAEKVVSLAEKEIFTVAEKKIKSACIPIQKIIDGTVDKLKSISERKEYVTGVPSGFTRLDSLLLGFQKSDLIILAARPSMGKTSLALNMAMNAACESDKYVAFFSLEMSSEQLSMRLISSETRIDFNRIRRGIFSTPEWDNINKAVMKIRRSKLFIDDSPNASVFEISSKIRRLKAEKKCDLVIIDYLQLMEPRDSRLPREQQISEISRSLKGFAKEFDLPVITLSQLNRQPDTREDKTPQLSDLRESGAIEQDADVVIFLYRDEVYYKENSKEKGIARIIVAKHRNGPTADNLKLAFRKEYTLFGNLEESDIPM